MAEIVLPILCDMWTWDPNNWCTIKFNENGTGELYCRVEFNLFIAAEFDWKAQSKQKIEASFPAMIDIDMTLSKRNTDTLNLMKAEVLEDTAFRLKSYRLQIEKGSFQVNARTTYGSNPVYKYRLLWDKSPYPPLDEWKKQSPAKAGEYWERKDFYRDKIEA